MTKLIFVDVTHLEHYFEKGRTPTGVQRVTWESIKGMRRTLGDARVRLLKFDTKAQQLKYAAAHVFDSLPAAQASGDNLATADRPIANWQNLEPKMLQGQTVFLSEVLVSAEIYLHFTKIKSGLNIRIVQVIYDIIPLARPQYCVGAFVRSFAKIIPLALGLADEIIAISEFTKQDLLRFCGSMISSGTRIHVWPLPHEFPTAKSDLTRLPEFVQKSFVVFGGTIEDRKNQHVAVSAWRKLSRKHGAAMPQLVLVGKFGKITWTHIKMRATLLAEKLGGKKIIALHRINDNMLRALYDNCLFSIYISSYEGWGLPIGESLWCGKAVLATRDTSLPEVGGSLADYCDFRDEASVMAAIERLAFDETYRASREAAIAKSTLRSWQDTTQHLAQILNAA